MRRSILLLVCSLYIFVAGCTNHAKEVEQGIVPTSWIATTLLKTQKHHDSFEIWYKDLLFSRLDYSRISDSYLFDAALKRLGDSNLHRYSDSILLYKLIALLGSEDISSTINDKNLMEKIADYEKKIPFIKTPLIEDQIWDENFPFVVNAQNPASFEIKPDIPEFYLILLSRMSPNQSPEDFYRTAGNLCIQEFPKISNESIRLSVHFKFLLKLVEFYKINPQYSDRFYISACADSLTNYCTRVHTGTVEEKARYLVACAKLLALIDPDYVYLGKSTEYLTLAKGYCQLSSDDSLMLERINSIEYKAYYRGKNYISFQLIEDAYYNVVPWSPDIDTIVTTNQLEAQLIASQFKMAECWKDFNTSGYAGVRNSINIICLLLPIHDYLEKNSAQLSPALYCDYLILLSELHRYNLELEKSASHLYKALEIQLKSNEPLFLMQFHRTAYLVEMSRKDRGIYTTDTITRLPPHYFHGPLSYVPRDSRLWVKADYDSVEKWIEEPFNDRFYHKGEDEMSHHFLDMGYKNALKKLAFYYAKQNKGLKAYALFARHDSLMDLMNVPGAAFTERQKKELFPKDDMLQKEITDRNKKIMFVSIGTAILFIAFLIAGHQRRKASRLARYNEYRSNIWQELGHLPGSSIDDSYLKLRRSGVSPSELATLEELKDIISSLFASIAQGESEEGNSLKAEIKMAELYLDYSNRIHRTNIELDSSAAEDVLVPPALILSCARNAIQHGKLLKVPRARIKIITKQELNHVTIAVKNNGETFPETLLKAKNIGKRSTGFRNMESVLKYYNRGKRILNPVRWENITDDFYTVQTTLKVRL